MNHLQTITYISDRGVLALDPTTGKTSDVLQPNAFARETEKTGGLLPLDMNTARHTPKEGNPLIAAMAKDAVRAAIQMLGVAASTPEAAQTDMGILKERRQALQEKLNAMQ